MGYGIRDRRRTYPHGLQGLLGDGYEVGNFGNSGRRILRKSLKGWDQRGFIFMPQHEEARAVRPHLVICNLGINDLMDWDQLGEEDLVDDYRTLLQTYKTPAAVPRLIIWHRLAPLFPGRPLWGDPRVEDLNAAIGEVARLEEVEVIDMADPLSAHAEWFPDKLHPKEEAEAIARVTAEYPGGGNR